MLAAFWGVFHRVRKQIKENLVAAEFIRKAERDLEFRRLVLIEGEMLILRFA
jgi:hypothetical protein